MACVLAAVVPTVARLKRVAEVGTHLPACPACTPVRAKTERRMLNRELSNNRRITGLITGTPDPWIVTTCFV